MKRSPRTSMLVLLIALPVGPLSAQGYHDRQWGGTVAGDGDDDANALARDPSGNIYIGGIIYSTTVDFDFSAGISPFAGDATFGKAFVAKYDSAGVFHSVIDPVQSSGTQRINSVLTDADGNLYVEGRFGGTATIGNGAAAITATASGSDLFLVKYDPAGNTVWVRTFTGPSTEFFSNQSLALDGQSHLFATGQFGAVSDTSPATFNPEPGTITYQLTAPSPGAFGFVVKLDTNGNVMADAEFGPICDGTPPRLAADASAGIYIAAATTCGGSPAKVALIKTSSSLTGIDWFESFGDASGDVFEYGISVRASDGVVALAGEYFGDTDFDPGPEVHIFPHGGSVTNGNGYLLQLANDGSYRTAGTLFGEGHSFLDGVAFDGTGRLFYSGGFADNFIDPTVPDTHHAAAAVSSDGVFGEIETNGRLGWLATLQSLTAGCYIDPFRPIPVSRVELVLMGDYSCGQVDLDSGTAPAVFDPAGGFDSFLIDTRHDDIFTDSFESP